MALRESIEHSGRWLFRWRSYLPIAAFLIVIPALAGFRYPHGSHDLDEAWEAICLVVSLTGLGIRAWVVGTTPSGTSGRNTHAQIATTLNTSGWYSIVRHPLYLGNYFMWLGIAMLPRHLWTVAVVSLIFWLYYERIMLAEENFLRDKFGAEFEEWSASTPAFIPDVRHWRSPSLPFSLRTVLRREYSGMYAVIVSFTLIEVLDDRIANHVFVIDTAWAVIFAAATVVYLTLLTLKRRTRLLQIEGR